MKEAFPWGHYGVNITIKDTSRGALERLLSLIGELKFGLVRLEFDWYEPVDEAFMDDFVAALSEREVRILGLLTGLVPGTLMNLFGNSKFRQPLDELEAFLEYLRRVVSRYKDRIRDWEIWNEQNTARFWLRRPSAEEYARVLKASAPAIKAIDPGARVMMGSICGNDVDFLAPGIPKGYLQAVLDCDTASLVDAYGFHPYTWSCYASFDSVDSTVQGIQKRIDHFFQLYPKLGKPSWITEIGISRTWVRLTEEAIARVYMALLEDLCRRDIPTILWCLTDFDDAHYVPGNPETAFGLASLDGRLNKTGQTLKAWAQSLT